MAVLAVIVPLLLIPVELVAVVVSVAPPIVIEAPLLLVRVPLPRLSVVKLSRVMVLLFVSVRELPVVQDVRFVDEIVPPLVKVLLIVVVQVPVPTVIVPLLVRL